MRAVGFDLIEYSGCSVWALDSAGNPIQFDDTGGTPASGHTVMPSGHLWHAGSLGSCGASCASLGENTMWQTSLGFVGIASDTDDIASLMVGASSANNHKESNFELALTSSSPSPASSPTEAPGPTVDMTAVGDPHLSNMRGEHFDIYQQGALTLLQLPKHANPDNTLLFVEADARRMGHECAVYFQAVAISGAWTNQSGTVRFFANAHGTPPGRRWREWMRFGTVEIKVVRRTKGTDYLNVYARVGGQSGYDVGGLLGSDDHAAAATRPPDCSRRHRATLASSFLGASE